MLEYEAAKFAIAQNEQIHRTHQISAIYTSAHLASPISSGNALSMAQATSAHLTPPISATDALSMVPEDFFSTHETVDPCLPLLASHSYQRRAGNKRACEDLQQDAFEFKRRQCLMPGFAVANQLNPSPRLERLGKPSPRKFGDMEGSTIANACYQNIGSFFTEEEVNLNSSLRSASKLGHVASIGCNDRSTENTDLILQEHSRKFVHIHLQQARKPLHCETMLEVGLHNNAKSKFKNDDANKDPLVVQAVINNRGNNCMRPHVCRTSSDSNGQISDVPFFLPTALVEKTIACQEEDHVSTPSQAQRGKQFSHRQVQRGTQSSLSFSQPNPKVLVDVTNKFQVTATPDVKKRIEEDDTHRLSQRHKQIEFGKNTLGYERYLESVPKSKRKGKDPRTPNPKQMCSKRSWDGQIRQWRRLLHEYDPPVEDGEELAEDMTLLKPKQKKNDKPELGEDDIDPNILRKEILSRLQEIAVAGATGEVANKDDGLSIYDDWMDC